MWFKNLMGFEEESPQQVRRNIEVQGDKLISKINGAEYVYGRLEIPLLESLRQRNSLAEEGKLQVSEVVSDVQFLHQLEENEAALFQVASQFNLLEMLHPDVTPEAGVDIYEQDPTQGPACAIACGAGTIYRNYFVPLNGQTGQTAHHQIDCMADVHQALQNGTEPLWKMRNGYLLIERPQLDYVNQQLKKLSVVEYEKLKGKLRVGIQWNTQVTLNNSLNFVTQVYASALPVGYHYNMAKEHWEKFARFVLEAAYEATLYAGLENYRKTGNNRIFLTLLGGGVFENKMEWITEAIKKAFLKFKNIPLDIRMVSYRSSNPAVLKMIDELR